MKIRPLQDQVVIQRNKPSETSIGGIIIPSSAQEKLVEGIIVAVGTGVYLKNGTVRPLDVKVGDVVLFEKWVKEVELNGEKVIIARESELLGVVEK